MSLAVFVAFNAVGTSPVFGIKLEERYFPPGSEHVVRSGRIGIIVATAMIVMSIGLAPAPWRFRYGRDFGSGLGSRLLHLSVSRRIGMLPLRAKQLPLRWPAFVRR